MIIRIPNKVIKYKEGTTPKERIAKHLIYGWKKNEKNRVVLWVRYPSYDFIFAVPMSGHKYYGQEYCLFTIRDSRNKNIVKSIYLDKDEYNQMVDGFRSIKRFYKEENKNDD